MGSDQSRTANRDHPHGREAQAGGAPDRSAGPSTRTRAQRMAARFGPDDVPMRRIGPLYWAPERIVWWVGALFMVGSSCFMAGPAIAAAGFATTAGVVYFAGSIFFTAAAYLQYVDVAKDAPARADGARRARLAHFDPKRLEWLAATVQLAGTLFFNLSTFSAMDESFDLQRAEHLVWAPDALGSICFLVASLLALAEARGGWRGATGSGISLRIARVNLIGSVAFGFSAVAAYIVPDTGEMIDAAASNITTFAGAYCFFVAAYWLWPEAEQHVGASGRGVP